MCRALAAGVMNPPQTSSFNELCRFCSINTPKQLGLLTCLITCRALAASSVLASPRANGFNDAASNGMHRQSGVTSGRAFVRPDRHQMAGSIIEIVKGPHRYPKSPESRSGEQSIAARHGAEGCMADCCWAVMESCCGGI